MSKKKKKKKKKEKKNYGFKNTHEWKISSEYKCIRIKNKLDAGFTEIGISYETNSVMS